MYWKNAWKMPTVAAGDKHAAADHRDDDLREAPDEADRRAGCVGEEVRATARVGELLREVVDLGRALPLAVEGTDDDAPAISLLDGTRQVAHPLLALRGELEVAPCGELGHQHREHGETDEHGSEQRAVHVHHHDGAGHAADRREQAQQAGLQDLRHLVEVVGGAAHDLTRAVRIEEGERQTVHLLRELVAQRQVEALGETGHREALQRVERRREHPYAQVDGDGATAGLPSDDEGLALGERTLDARPEHVDDVRRERRRRDGERGVERDGDDDEHEPPVLVARLAPQARDGAPDVARHFGLLGARRTRSGSAPRLHRLLHDALLLGLGLGHACGPLDLLRHATRLPSSATPRWRGRPRSSP